MLVVLAVLFGLADGFTPNIPKIHDIQRVFDLKKDNLLISNTHNRHQGSQIDVFNLREQRPVKRIVVSGIVLDARLSHGGIVTHICDDGIHTIFLDDQVAVVSSSAFTSIDVSGSIITSLDSHNNVHWFDMTKASSRSVNYRRLATDINHNDNALPCCVLYTRKLTFVGRSDGNVDVIGECRKRVIGRRTHGHDSAVCSMCVVENDSINISIMASHLDGSVSLTTFTPDVTKRGMLCVFTTPWLPPSTNSNVFTARVESNGKFILRTTSAGEMFLGSALTPSTGVIIPVPMCLSPARCSESHLIAPTISGVYDWTLNDN